MARLRQALLYCLHNVGIGCQTGSGGFLSELLLQIRRAISIVMIMEVYIPWLCTMAQRYLL